MIELMIFLAKSMPEEQLLGKLKSCIEAYERQPTPENKHELKFNLMLANHKLMTEDESMEESIHKAEEVKDFHDFQAAKKEMGI